MIYNIIGQLIKGFQVEPLVFLGGYILAYQFILKEQKIILGKFVKKNFLILLVPCYIFGLIYFFIFKEENEYKYLLLPYYLTNGIGYLWYLPMMFWCFIIMYFLYKMKMCSNNIIFGIFLLLSVIPTIALPLGLTRLPYFLFYFYW